MSASPDSIKLTGLAKKLVTDGFLDEKSAIEAQIAAKKKRMTFSAYLVEEKHLSAMKIATAAKIGRAHV